ncbi:DUF3192 domain-containing protein [Chromatiaceae bacterium AAb-1]|nr:DUF3192 domain-containing protein [Chromatiaceae bacterium AAb-1]
MKPFIKLKTLFMFALGGLGYVLLMLSVMLFYKDDPEQMNWQDREAFNARIINKLDPQEQHLQDDIIKRLGVPDITAALKQQNTIYQLLYYRTHWKVADGITTADECTPLLFRDRKLIAKGDAAIEHYKSLGAVSIF